MTMRSKIATSAFVAAVLSVGMATADAAHQPGTLGSRYHSHPPKHARVVGHLPHGVFKLPTSAVTTCRLAACRPHHGVGSDDGSGQPGNADHGDDGGGGSDPRNCLDDGCRQWQD